MRHSHEKPRRSVVLVDLRKAVQLLDSTWELVGGVEGQPKVQSEPRFLGNHR